MKEEQIQEENVDLNDADSVENQDAPVNEDKVEEKEVKEEKKSEAKKEKKKSSKQQIEDLNQENADLQDKYLRLNAEYQNYRKRVEKEKADIRKYSTEKIFEELVPVLDNFERALSMIHEESMSEDALKVADGVKMIKKSFDGVFEKHNVKKIDAIGQPFDPELHHAVMTEDSEDHESDTVIQVLQEGYTLNGKVIRPAMVKVSN